MGIAALFVLMSLAAGAEKAFEDALSSMGKNLLAIGTFFNGQKFAGYWFRAQGS